MRLQLVHSLIPLCFGLANASVTVYNQRPLGVSTTATATTANAAASYTGAAAYNPTILNAPPIPDPKPSTSFNIQLPAGGMPGMSIPIPGAFFGFSVEFSVANQVRKCPSNHLVRTVHSQCLSSVGKNRYIIQTSLIDLLLISLQYFHSSTILEFDGQLG